MHRILKDVLRESPSSESTTACRSEPAAWRTARRPRRGRSAKIPCPAQEASRAPERQRTDARLHGPIPEDELHDIAEESSQSERRADDAERELMEWKKIKFMEQQLGDEFDGLIVSVTKFGMFVELTDLFIEGLVPLGSMTDDHYLTTRTRGRSSASAAARPIPWATRFACWWSGWIRPNTG